MKYNALLLIVLLLQGCITYDPPSASLKIFNNSDAAIYVYESCEDSLMPSQPLKLFYQDNNSGTDEFDEKMPLTISPNYRINAYTFGGVNASGSSSHPILPCKNDLLCLFFISEKNMKEHSWADICKEKLFEQKMCFSKGKLDSLHWKVNYNPTKH